MPKAWTAPAASAERTGTAVTKLCRATSVRFSGSLSSASSTRRAWPGSLVASWNISTMWARSTSPPRTPLVTCATMAKAPLASRRAAIRRSSVRAGGSVQLLKR